MFIKIKVMYLFCWKKIIQKQLFENLKLTKMLLKVNYLESFQI